jgi:hypothetical protein
MHLPVAVHRDPRARRAHGHGVLRERLSHLRIVDRSRATVLATHCRTADNVLTRGVGLLTRSALRPGEALLITRTSAITMMFMRFAIDAVFVDRSRRVVKVVADLRPWTLVAAAPGAAEVLELPAGTVARTGTQVGDELDYEPS